VISSNNLLSCPDNQWCLVNKWLYACVHWIVLNLHIHEAVPVVLLGPLGLLQGTVWQPQEPGATYNIYLVLALNNIHSFTKFSDPKLYQLSFTKIILILIYFNSMIIINVSWFCNRSFFNYDNLWCILKSLFFKEVQCFLS